MTDVIPKKRPFKWVTTSIRLPDFLLEEIQRIAKEMGHSQTSAIVEMLHFAVNQHRTESADDK